jgi:hypothetical protein
MGLLEFGKEFLWQAINMSTHPLLGSLASKNNEQLEATIADLNKKLLFAGQMRNQVLVNQLMMALTEYKQEYQRRMNEIWNKKYGNTEKKIDIE